jgi:hypothetical protein
MRWNNCGKNKRMLKMIMMLCALRFSTISAQFNPHLLINVFMIFHISVYISDTISLSGSAGKINGFRKRTKCTRKKKKSCKKQSLTYI